MKIRALSACVFFAGLAYNGGFASAQTGSTCGYTLRFDVDSVKSRGSNNLASKSMEITGKAYQSGRKARIEMLVRGRNQRVTIVNDRSVYSLRPDRNVAIKKPLSSEAGDKLYEAFPLLFLHPVDPSAYWKGAKKIGAERLAGIQCDIWKVKLSGNSGQEASIWMPRSKTRSAPIKAQVEMSVPTIAEGTKSATGPKFTCTALASEVRFNVPVSQSQFVVPRTYAIQEARAAASNMQALRSDTPRRQQRPGMSAFGHG